MISLLVAAALLFGGLTVATRVIAARVQSDYPPQGERVPLAAGEIHVVERGARPEVAEATLVFIHGASANAADPLFALGDRLAGRHRLIAIDRPGHGWSSRPGGTADASPKRQAEAIAAALEARGVRRAIVVGHSFGGVVALTLALERPDLVAGLMLLAPVSHPWPGGIAWYYHAASNMAVGSLFANTIAVPATALMLEPGIDAVFFPQKTPEGYLEGSRIRLLLRPETFKANAEDVAGLLDFVRGQSGRYGEIEAPVTIITGDRDTIVSPTLHSRALSRQIAGARLIVLPGVGHQPHYADPDLTVAEIEALVARAR